MPNLPAAADQLTWAVGAIRVQDGAFIIETRNPHLEALGRADPSTTTLASVLPPTTVLLAEGHDLGDTLTMVRDTAATEPEVAEGLTQLDQALQIVGGWEAITGWMGEGGIAVTRDGEQVGGGIVITPTDAAAAEQLFTKLRGLLALAGGQAGITVTDEQYGGTTVTTIHLGNLEGVDAFAAPLPDDLSVSFAATDEVVVLGVGTDFTKAVLDARTGARWRRPSASRRRWPRQARPTAPCSGSMPSASAVSQRRTCPPRTRPSTRRTSSPISRRSTP